MASKTKRQLRAEKKLRKSTKEKEKYPDIVKKIVNESDVILEILDARFPEQTRNKDIEELIIKNNKKIIYVLNKSDLIKKKIRQKLSPHIYVSCKKRSGIKALRDLIKRQSSKIKKQDKVNIGIIGYPNTGKSSLINLLIGKKSAGTGADAGFTKGIQKLKLNQDIMLLDTPGVIPEKKYSSIEKEKIAEHTIVGGRSYSQVKDPEIVIAKIMTKYPKLLEKHYKINAKEDSEVLLEKLGRKLKFLKKGGIVDNDKTARHILKEWQKGEIKI